MAPRRLGTMTTSYRTTKSGIKVVCGRTDEVVAGCEALIRFNDGTFVFEYIGSVGKSFPTRDGQMVYGYIAAKPGVESVGESDQEPTDEEWSSRMGVNEFDAEGAAEIAAERAMENQEYFSSTGGY